MFSGINLSSFTLESLGLLLSLHNMTLTLLYDLDLGMYAIGNITASITSSVMFTVMLTKIYIPRSRTYIKAKVSICKDKKRPRLSRVKLLRLMPENTDFVM